MIDLIDQDQYIGPFQAVKEICPIVQWPRCSTYKKGILGTLNHTNFPKMYHLVKYRPILLLSISIS